MEQDPEDLPEQGMTQLILADVSLMMDEALKEMINRAIQRGLPEDKVGNVEQRFGRAEVATCTEIRSVATRFSKQALFEPLTGDRSNFTV